MALDFLDRFKDDYSSYNQIKFSIKDQILYTESLKEPKIITSKLQSTLDISKPKFQTTGISK